MVEKGELIDSYGSHIYLLYMSIISLKSYGVLLMHSFETLSNNFDRNAFMNEALGCETDSICYAPQHKSW